MHTCSVIFGFFHSVAIFCTPTPDDDGWKIGDIISLATTIITALGVLTALWVPYFQNKHAAAETLAKEKSEIYSLIRAIRTEVAVTWSNYARIRPPFESFKSNSYVTTTLLFSEKSFSIYENSGANIGKISDVKLLERIVETYGLAKSLIQTFILNNAMLRDLEALNALPLEGGTHRPYPRQNKIEAIQQNLRSHAQILKKLDASLKESVDDLLSKIDSFAAQ